MAQVTPLYSLRFLISQRYGQFFGSPYNRVHMVLTIGFANGQQANCLETHIRNQRDPTTNAVVFDGDSVKKEACNVVIVFPLNIVQHMEPRVQGLMLEFDTPQNANLWVRYLPICTKMPVQPGSGLTSKTLFISYNWTFQQLAHVFPVLIQPSGPVIPGPPKAVQYPNW